MPCVGGRGVVDALSRENLVAGKLSSRHEDMNTTSNNTTAAVPNVSLLTADDLYGGGGQGNFGGVQAAPLPWHNQSHMLNITLPPLGAVVFKPA
jgi:1,4-alpha-glucan branching enzyme